MRGLLDTSVFVAREQGRPMGDWQQMYAEERHVWQELLRGQPEAAGRREIEHALAQSQADELELANAIRARDGLPRLTPLDAEDARAARERVDATNAARAGCLSLVLPIGWLAR